jgi:hypothetical protein
MRSVVSFPQFCASQPAALCRYNSGGGNKSYSFTLWNRIRSNPLMLEWSALGYWLTMCFILRAINRWRACHHLEKLAELGFKIRRQQRSLADCLPIPLHRVSRQLGEIELRTIFAGCAGFSGSLAST